MQLHKLKRKVKKLSKPSETSEMFHWTKGESERVGSSPQILAPFCGAEQNVWNLSKTV